MRIVAGDLAGRRLVAPKGGRTRPTSDRARESLFSRLAGVEGNACLDLFAGSGALGLEALSRGASRCTFVEVDHGARLAVRANIETLGLRQRSRVVGTDARRFLRGTADGDDRFDLVFVDPPYRLLQDFIPTLDAYLLRVTAPDARLVVEANAPSEAPIFAGFTLVSSRRVGGASVSLYIRSRGVSSVPPSVLEATTPSRSATST